MKILEITREEYRRKYKKKIEAFLPDYAKKANRTVEEVKNDIHEALNNAIIRFWVFLEGNKVKGFCIIELIHEIGQAMLDQIYFAPGFDKPEHWRIVTDSLEKEVRRWGVKKIFSISHKDFGCGRKAKKYTNFVWPGLEPVGHLFVRRLEEDE